MFWCGQGFEWVVRLLNSSKSCTMVLRNDVSHTQCYTMLSPPLCA